MTSTDTQTIIAALAAAIEELTERNQALEDENAELQAMLIEEHSERTKS